MTREARERAIAGGGPTLIEAVTMRMHGHAAHDDMKYVPKALIEEWKGKDPIDRQVARAVELGVDVDALRAEVQGADRRRHPGGPGRPDARPGDRDRGRLRRRGQRAARRARAVQRVRALMATMTYLQAISDGLRTEMREDERVLVMGEDIGVFGGAFKVTDGFIDEFGAARS
jgi:hypothetical protein